MTPTTESTESIPAPSAHRPQQIKPIHISIMGLIIGVIGVIVAIVAIFDNRTQQSVIYNLAYEVFGTVDILKLDQSANNLDSLEIFLEGQPIESLISQSIRFINNGNQPIRPDDFITPLEVILSEGDLIQYDYTDNSDSLILQNVIINRPTLVDSTSITLLPMLLNPGDSFTLTLMVANTKSIAFDIQGRIVNITDLSIIERSEPIIDDSLPPDLWFLLVAGTVFVTLSSFAVLASAKEVREASDNLVHSNSLMDEYEKVMNEAQTLIQKHEKLAASKMEDSD